MSSLQERLSAASREYAAARKARREAWNAYHAALQRERAAFEDFIAVRERRDRRLEGDAEAAWEVAALVE